MAGSPRGASVRARDMIFTPLDSGGRVEAVTRRLADAIALGFLRDSEQLPSEADLAASFGVSTVTVREALTVLREQGLVTTRRGRGGGSFVTAPAGSADASVRARLADLAPSELRDLADHYAAVSGAAAALAAERADDDDVARIRLCGRRFAEAPDAGARRRAEGHLHVEVAAAGQSARLTRAELDLQAEAGPLLWLPLQDDDVHARCVEQHARLADAVARGDAEAARAAVVDHVRDAAAWLGALWLAEVGR